jgi:aryl-alcohol dehydrogenase-like predicted oxidoreductase
MTGSVIDNVILGTAALGGIWGKIRPEESAVTIFSALEQGIQAIDTAPAYGDAEDILGQVLRLWEGKRPQISTKVGRKKCYAVDDGDYDFSPEGMLRSVENSLETLGIPTIDILFLHDPDAIIQSDIEAVLKQLEYFKHEGYAKKIGLGGNPPQWLEPYLQSDLFEVIMGFNQLNACNIEALDTIIPFCAQNNKTYYAASPLNMGLLGAKFSEFTTSPPYWLDLDSVAQAKKINTIAEKYRMPLHELAHRFLFTIEGEFKVVMGATDKKQLTDTIKAIEKGRLSPEVYAEVLKMLNQR